MPDTPGPTDPNTAAETEREPESDGPLRIFSENLGIDYDSVVERAKRWVAENPLPPDLGPEPFNVGKPRPPVD